MLTRLPNGEHTFIKVMLKLVTVALIFGLLVRLELAGFSRQEKYDLLFSIDYNAGSYLNTDAQGLVIRVKNYRAVVIDTGKWRIATAFYEPMLLVCYAATGNVQEIEIPFELPNASSSHAGYTGKYIPVAALDSLIVSPSSAAPDGFSLPGVVFGRPYLVFDLVEKLAFQYKPFYALIDSFTFHLLLSDNAYVECLQQVKGRQAGLTVHFIGWIMK